jgi:molybdenum cofactor biosynthesis enzyme MoaA
MKTNISEYPKNYCPLFFKGLSTHNDHYTLCCSSDVVGKSDTIDFLSNELNTIRSTWEKEQIKFCNGCWQSEQGGGTSRRQIELEWLMQNPEIDETSTELLCLDYDVGNQCNAACIMCGPGSSSLWQSELGQGFISTTDPTKQLDLSKLRRIYLVGGEPFLIKETKNMLLNIKQQQGTLENLEVECQTNGSNFKNNQIMSLLHECKKVTIKISIDAVGKEYEYIRHPLKWKTIDENFQFLLKNYKFEVEVGATIGIHNIDCLPDFFKWFQIQQKTFNLSNRVFGINPVNKEFRFDSATIEMKNIWLEKLSEFSEHDWATRASSMIENSSSAADNNRWLDYFKTIDNRRNLKWQNGLPDLANTLEKTTH